MADSAVVESSAAGKAEESAAESVAVGDQASLVPAAGVEFAGLSGPLAAAQRCYHAV